MSTVVTEDLPHFLQARFLELAPAFYTRLQPTPLKAPYSIADNPRLSEALGLAPAQIRSGHGMQLFSGDVSNENTLQAFSTVYSGHQFGIWAGQLGDGRAITLGELTDRSGDRHEIQLKGSGLTPYSRSGDGRAVLRSSIREYLCSEAMHTLGIPSTRALCLTGASDFVFREQPETAAVVTRVAPSFIRFGHFEHWYYNHRHEDLKALADFVIRHYYPALANTEQPYLALLSEVVQKTARLIAQWQAVGFMHGVLNTDNMSILGLTLDYGPFGFMEAFDEGHICNHSDHQGRYAYHMQPSIGLWNLRALGQAMLPLTGSVEETEAALGLYKSAFTGHWETLVRHKFGLPEQLADSAVLRDISGRFFSLLQENHADFTLSFRALCHLSSKPCKEDSRFTDLFIDREAASNWLHSYRDILSADQRSDQERRSQISRCNPKYVLRNYLAQVAIQKAQQNDFTEIQRLQTVLSKPFDEQPGYDNYAALPPDWASELEVSCSS